MKKVKIILTTLFILSLIFAYNLVTKRLYSVNSIEKLSGPKQNVVTHTRLPIDRRHPVEEEIRDQKLQDLKRLAALASLPYLQGYDVAPKWESVTQFDKSLAYKGYNL